MLFFATHTVSYDWKWTRSLDSGNSKACFVLFIIQLSCSYGLVYHRKSSKILLHIFYRQWDIMRYGQLKQIKKYAQHCITVIVMFDYKADANSIVCVSQRANVIDSSFDCEYIGCKRLFELIVNIALSVIWIDLDKMFETLSFSISLLFLLCNWYHKDIFKKSHSHREWASKTNYSNGRLKKTLPI